MKLFSFFIGVLLLTTSSHATEPSAGEIKEVTLPNNAYYLNTSSSSTVECSSNLRYVLLDVYTDDNQHMLQLVDAELNTISTPSIPISSDGFDIIGISDDGDALSYKRRPGPYYGNQYYQYNISTDTQSMISLGPNGEIPNFQSYYGSMDLSQNHLTLMSFADNWFGDKANGHIFYRNLETSTTVQVSKNIYGGDPNATSYISSFVNNHENYIVFESGASDIVDNDNNNITDLFLYNTLDQTTIRISKNPLGDEFNQSSRYIEGTTDGKILFGTLNSSFGYIDHIYSYNISTAQVEEFSSKSFGSLLGISRDGNRVLYTKMNNDGYIDWVLYDKKYDKEIVVFTDYSVNSSLKQPVRLDNTGTKVIYFLSGKAIIQKISDIDFFRYNPITIDVNTYETNSLSSVQLRTFYQFILDQKSNITIDASTTTDFNTAGWLSDGNGFKISSLHDWDAGTNGQVKLEHTLDAGTYSFEIFSEDGNYGNYTFSLNSVAYEEPIPQAWEVNIPAKISVNKNTVITIPLEVAALTSAASLDNLVITSDDLPTGLQLEKTSIGWNVIGEITTSDSFSLILNINDSPESFAQTHQIDFTVYAFTVDGLMGEGRESNIAIKKLPDGTFQPLKFSFFIEGIDISTVESISSVFMEEPRLAMVANDWPDWADGRIKASFEVGVNPYYGASSSEDFMDQITDIDESERLLTIRLLLKDGSSIDRKILKPIPVEKIDGYISIRSLEYGGYFWTSKDLYNSSQPGVGTTHYVDYGEEVRLVKGKWRIAVDEHNLYVNLETSSCGLVFVAEKDIVKNKTILSYDYGWDAEHHPLSVFVKRVLPEGSVADGVLSFLEIGVEAGHIWRLATTMEGSCEFEGLPGVMAAARGTTFSINHTYGETSVEVYEGAVDLVSKGISVHTMESYSDADGSKKTINKIDLLAEAKSYLDQTSLAQSAIDDTVFRLKISTNVANASYALIGKNVRVGSGTLYSFWNISEGEYTLRFLPVAGYIPPVDVLFVFNGENIVEELQINYMPVGLDTDSDEISDNWELGYFGQLTIAHVTSDYDRDGYSDLQEYLNQLAGQRDENGYLFNPLEPNAPGGTGYNPLLGDVNQDGAVDLSDAVIALQIVAGIVPTDTVATGADVNGDDKIGIEEVLYGLGKMAGF